MLENGSDLHVNERQKIQHYLLKIKKMKKEECQIAIFYFTQCVLKLCYYSNLMHACDWKSAVKHDGGV